MKTNYAMIVISEEYVSTYYYESWNKAQKNFLEYTGYLNSIKHNNIKKIILTKDERIRIVWNG